jgi:hypothetical protein
LPIAFLAGCSPSLQPPHPLARVAVASATPTLVLV